MNELPDIIATDIINEEWDIFWQQAEVAALESDKPVLIISSPYSAGSSEEAQLHKMLQACTITDAQYQILQLPEEKAIPWHKLREKLNPKIILLIGTASRQLGISAMLNMNNPNHFNGCVWVPTLSIGELEKQPEMKKQLWLNGLKPVFVDKSLGDLI